VTVWNERRLGECRCCSRRRSAPPLLPAIGSCGLGVGPSWIRTPARPSRRSIGGQGLRGCLRSSHPAKLGVCEGPPRFLLLRRHRSRPRLSCYRGSREEAFSYPPLCWLDTARQFSAPGKVILDKSPARSQCPTGELRCSRACPLYPQKRTLTNDAWMSALCSQPRTGGAETRRHARRRCCQCPIALNNGSEHLPNSGGQSHCQRPPERHSDCGVENVCAARSCPNCTEKRKEA